MRKYYKYIDIPWTQPVLSANGTLGGSSFAVTCTQATDGHNTTTVKNAYKVFDNDNSTSLGLISDKNVTPQSITFYNPIPISFETLTITFGSNSNGNWLMISGSLSGSNDNQNWTSITTFSKNNSLTLTLNGSNDYYNYYKITATTISTKSGYYDAIVKEVNLNNTTSEVIHEGTPSDYDFYEDVEIRKTVRKTERKYYKYQYVSYTTPTNMTSDGTWNGDSFAVKPSGIYNQFDGNNTTYVQGNPTYVYFPQPFKLEEYTCIAINDYSRGYPPTAVTIYGSNDETNWTQLASGSINRTNYGSTTISVSTSDTYKYFRFNYSYDYTGQTYLREVGLSGQILAAVESTSSDYDFYKDIDIYKVPQKVVRKYYKYADTPWVQPVLSADGTIGGDSFAVTASSSYGGNTAYRAFDSDTTSTYWQSNAYPSEQNPQYIEFYNPTALKVSQIKIKNSPTQSWNFAITSGYVEASSNGTNYTNLETFTNSETGFGAEWTINLSSNNTYKYYRIYATATAGNVQVKISNMTITAVIREIEESDSSDYDFYEDVDKYKAVKF